MTNSDASRSAPETSTRSTVSRESNGALFSQDKAFVEAGEFDAAYDELYNARLRAPEATLDEPVLKVLAIGLAKKRQWDEAAELMQEYIDACPDSSDSMRLRLANVLLKGTNDGRAAFRVLKEVNQEALSEDAHTTFKKLLKTAKESR